MRQRIDAIEEEARGAEYFTACHIDTAAKQAAAQLRPPTPPSEPHPLESGEITEDWINQTIDIHAIAQRLEKRRGVLLTLANEAKNKAQSLANLAAPRILAGYQSELKRLLTDVRAVSDELGAVDTATKAIAADASPQWKQLAELADEYATLRAAQLSNVSSDVQFATSPNFPGEPHASDLYLRNLDDLWPAWRQGGTDRSRIDMSSTLSASRPEPWPADPAELLLWLVRSDAQPWIPSDRQLQQLRQERHERNNPMPDVTPARFDSKTKTLVTESK